MLLAVDAGNSTVSFGFFEDGSLTFKMKAATRGEATSDEYMTFLGVRMGMADINPAMLDSAVISSVVPPLVHVLFETVKGFTGATPLLVSHRLKLPITINYKPPESLGPDRIAAASGAFTLYKGPVVVADFGTATTISVVDGSGAFIGGMIAPGLMTGYEALIAGTASLPRIGLTYPKKPIGGNTAEGLQSGLILGHAAMATGLIEKAVSELGGKAKVVLTGGHAPFLLPHIYLKAEHQPDLALLGLFSIYKLNAGK